MDAPTLRRSVGWLGAFVVLCIGVTSAHASTLGGIDSASISTFSFASTIDIAAECGEGSTSEPCVVPAGTVFDGDLEWFADVTVFGEVDGKLEVDGGTIEIADTGIVDDEIRQTGPGSVFVRDGAQLRGNKITEAGDGDLFVDIDYDGDEVNEAGAGDVVIGPNGDIEKKVKEEGPGSLTVEGFVGDNVEEKDAGEVNVASTGSVLSVLEDGAGSVTVAGDVRKDIVEKENGDVTILSGASVIGKIDERGDGDVIVEGPSTIGGNVKEDNAGNMVVGANATIGGDAESKTPGTCTISPQASIGGDLKEACEP